MMMKLLVLSLCLIATLGAPVEEQSGPMTFVNHRLLDVTPTTREQLIVLQHLEETGDLELDFWLPAVLNRVCKIRVPPNVYDRFVDLMSEHHIQYKVVLDSVQDLLARQHEEGNRISQHSFNGKMDHSRYHNLNEINNYIAGFANDFNGVVSNTFQNNTALGRPMYFIEITGAGPSAKKNIIIEAGIHAREWISPASIMYFIDKLLHLRIVPDSEAEFLYNNFNWFIAPMTNPDGYDYTWTSNRFWRKNRSITPGCSSSTRGVDLNRNFDANFGGVGSSASCGSDTFRGAKAFSEVESYNMWTLMKYVKDTYGHVDAYISVHSFSQLLLVPYAFDNPVPPPNQELTRQITDRASDAIYSLYGKTYRVGTAGQVLNYQASGGSSDWAVMNEGVTYSMTYELRPASGGQQGFVLHPEEIEPTSEEVWTSLYVIAEELHHLTTN